MNNTFILGKQKNVFFSIMTLAIFILLLSALCVTNINAKDSPLVTRGQSVKEDYQLVVTLLSEGINNPNQVDEVTTFIVEYPDHLKRSSDDIKCDLYYYLDGRLDQTVHGISLPYQFKQTYRGLVNGNYKVTFVVFDSLARTGKKELNITVVH